MSLVAGTSEAIQIFDFAGEITEVIPSTSGETVPISVGDQFVGRLTYTPEFATDIGGGCVTNAFTYRIDMGDFFIQPTDPIGVSACLEEVGIIDFTPASNATPVGFSEEELLYSVITGSILPETIQASALIAPWNIFWLSPEFEEILLRGQVTSATEVPEPASLMLFILGLSLLLTGHKREAAN
jgi:hypothetical protein